MTEGEAAKAQRRGLRRRQVPRWCLRVSVHLQRGSSQGTFLSWLAATSFCVAGTSFHSSLKKENKFNPIIHTNKYKTNHLSYVFICQSFVTYKLLNDLLSCSNSIPFWHQLKMLNGHRTCRVICS